jgi:hypothetical protein
MSRLSSRKKGGSFTSTRSFWDEYGKTFLTFSIGAFMCIIIVIYFVRRNRKSQASPQNENQAVPLKQATTDGTPVRTKDSLGELKCREVLEKIFQVPFAKCRPEFLHNVVTSTDTSSYRLELDCYNPELAIAVEYNGRQHYEYVPFFHRTRDAFYNQKYRDEIKRIKCRENGVTLIEVPYTVPARQIEDFIVEALSRSGKLGKSDSDLPPTPREPSEETTQNSETCALEQEVESLVDNRV